MRNFNDRRVMFDTKILFDIVDPARPDTEEARKAVELCNGGGWMGFVAAGSLKDLYYSLSKHKDERAARKAVEILTGALVVVPCGSEETQMSLCGDEPDFEDGLVRACAELNDAEYILSRDVQAFKGSKIKRVTCPEFVEIARRQAEADRRMLLG